MNSLHVFSAVLAWAVAPANQVDTRTGILDLVPENALGVLIIRDLESIKQRSEPLGEAWSRMLSADSLKGALWIADGLDDRGEFALALLPVAQGAEPASGQVLVLPVFDSAKLMTLWSPEPIEGDLFKITLLGRDAFLGTKGGYAVVSPDLANLKRMLGSAGSLSQRLSQPLREQVGRHDASIWFDPKAVIAHGIADPQQPWFHDAMGLTGAFLATHRQIIISASLQGSRFQFAGYFEPVEATRAGMGMRSNILLGGFPGGNSCGSIGFTGDDGNIFFQAVARRWAALWTASNALKDGRVPELEQRVVAVGRQISRGGLTVLMDGSGVDAKFSVCGWLESRRGSAALAGEIRSFIRFFQGRPMQNVQLDALAGAIGVRRGAQKIDDVDVDHIVVSFTESQPPEVTAMAAVFGEEQLLARMAPVGDRFVVFSLGGGEARMKDMIAAASSLASSSPPGATADSVGGGKTLEAKLEWGKLTLLMNKLFQVADNVYNIATPPDRNTRIDVSMHPEGAGFFWEVTIDPSFFPIGLDNR
ncbi:MAG: hypothetical protein ACYTHJ_07325 [Planctomycetota bacterium]|jgi:hypothetical protein